LEKIKNFLKKYKIPVIVATVMLIFVGTIVILLLLNKEEPQDDANKYDPPPIFEWEPVTYYEDYEVSISDGVVREIDNYEVGHSVFEVDKKDHLDWAENFVTNLKGNQFDYSKKEQPAVSGNTVHNQDQTLHYWKNKKEFFFYDVARDTMLFVLETPVRVPNIVADPRTEEGAKKFIDDINNAFFSADFEIVVNEVVKEGNFYRINYSRVLEKLPVFMYNTPTYLLVTPDGRLQEGRFLLAEFTKTGETTIFSGEEISEKIDTQGYSKFVDFEFADLSVHDEIGDDDYGYQSTGQEKANVILSEVDLFYYYTSKFQKKVEPSFFFSGKGKVEIEGENFDANFEVRGESISK
jgi:hypothetical protein